MTVKELIGHLQLSNGDNRVVLRTTPEQESDVDIDSVSIMMARDGYVVLKGEGV